MTWCYRISDGGNIFSSGSVMAALRLSLVWSLLVMIASILVSSFHVVGSSLVSSTKAAIMDWIVLIVVSASDYSALQSCPT